MIRKPFFLIDKEDVYCRILIESISDELEDIKFGYLNTIKDILKADIIIICGDSSFDKKLLWSLNIIKKPLILYHVLPDSPAYNRLAKRAKWVVLAKPIGSADYFPSPVLLSDIATTKYIERVLGREKLASKRGILGIIGLELEEEHRKKLVEALNLLIEDLDLNIVFIPILKNEFIKDILSGLKYSANVRLIQSEKYSAKGLLGIISRLDILITSNEKGVMCAMAVDRPVVGLAKDDELDDSLGNITNEEILFDIDKLSSDELYSKVKIAWVHRDTIAKDMKNRVAELKKKASEGIRQLEKEIA